MMNKVSTRSRAPLGDVTLAVANTEKQKVAEKADTEKLVKPTDKIVVSALKNSDSAPKRKQVQFRAGSAVARASLPKFCVCDPQHSSPLVACEQCSEWHMTSCCNVSKDTENMSVKPVCLPCRQLQILTKLLDKVKHAAPPSHAQSQAVCTKLRIPLPLNPTHDDALVHLAVFLLKAPELRSALCSKETTMDKVAVQLETCGVKRGQQGQLELLSDVSLATLRQACRMCALDANGSKSDSVLKLHSLLTGAAAPPLPPLASDTLPRKRAKTKPIESPSAPPKPNLRLAARRRRMLQTFQITELKQECKSRGLPTAGTQKEIVTRLVEYLGSQGDGKPHKKDCSCDICDLDNAFVVSSIQVPSDFQA